MRSIVCIAAIVAGLAGSPLATASDRSIARLVGISGNVLVSDESTIASAGEALRLAAGMRVLVTLNSGATVEYDDGCRVRLAAGERFEIRGERQCARRAVQTHGAYAPVLGKRP